jgi:mono/diheme cytochrome c family protein
MTSHDRGSRAATARLLLLFAAGMWTACAAGTAGDPAPVAPASAPPTVDAPLAPFFTSPQAARGQEVFTTVCSTCHGRNEFTGPIFAITWRAEPVLSLFEHISTNMPQDRPGSLTPEQYIDVLAYILQLNGIQPGARELVPDAALLARTEW